MATAAFTITLPEGVWIGDLSRDTPEAEIRVLAALPDDDVGVGHVEILHPDAESIVEAMRAEASVTAVEVFEVHDGRALVQFRTTEPLLLVPIQRTGIPIQLPFTISNGELDWEITAPHERLSELATLFEELGIPFEVHHVQQNVDLRQLLTDTQSELVDEAIERGYYDTPRECTLTELAEQLDMAPSTISETLHRAEEKIVKEFAGAGEEAPAPMRQRR